MILRKVGEIHIFKHRLYIAALEQARVLILGKYFLLEVLNTIYKHCHACYSVCRVNSVILESTLVIPRVLSPDRSISILFLKLAVIVNDHLLLIGNQMLVLKMYGPISN